MRRRTEDDQELEELKRHMALSAEEKLNYLEEINDFMNKAMPASSKEIWQRLKQEGW